MSDKNNAGARIADAVNEYTSMSHNPGYGREVSHVEASEWTYTAVLRDPPAVIEGEYEVLPNLTDLMDDYGKSG